MDVTTMTPAERDRYAGFCAMVLRDQIRELDGVITHAQLVAGGVDGTAIRRRLRRRELTRVYPRVYVDHTGPLPWRQRAWAAVLYAAPAALCWQSVSEPAKDDRAPIHVAIDQRRRVAGQPGLVLHRLTELDAHLYRGSSPPRLRLEDNALAMAGAAADELEVVGLLSATIGHRGVSVEAVRAALRRYPSLRRRRFVAALLDDLGRGASRCSSTPI